MNNDHFEDDRKRGRLFFAVIVIAFGAFYVITNQNSISEWMNSELASIEGFDDSFGWDNVENEIEASLVKHGDWDEDGLDNILEALLGSNMFEQDTDSDGFSDYDEFVNGYDPTTIEKIEIDNELLMSRYEGFLENYSNPDGGVLPFYYLEKANGLLDQGNTADAVANFANAVNLQSSIEAYETFIYDLYEVEDYAESLIVASDFVENFPEHSKAYFHRGFSKQQNGDDQGAELDYQKALEMGSTYPFVYNNLGALAEEKGNMDQARDYYQKAVDLDPENTLFADNLMAVSGIN